MNNSIFFTPKINLVEQYANCYVGGISKDRIISQKKFLDQIIDIISFGLLRKNTEIQHEKFTTDFTSNLLREIEKAHDRNNSYYIPKRIEFIHSNNKITLEACNDNTDGKKRTHISVSTPQNEITSNIINTATLSQFCKLQLALSRGILTEDDIRFTFNGEIDLSNTDAATESLLNYILFDSESLESSLENNAIKSPPSRISVPSTSFSNSLPIQSTTLKRNNSFLYNLLSKKTISKNRSINTKNTPQNEIVYSPEQKYLEDTLCKIVSTLKKTYSKGNTQSRNPECDGLFRTSGKKSENDNAVVSLRMRSLDIDKTERDTLVYLLKKAFSETNPIDEKIFLQMKDNPDKAANILYERLKKMPPIERKRFLIVLEFYSDAYQNADDNTMEKFNKNQLLTSHLTIAILPNIYDGANEMNPALIQSHTEEMRIAGDNIASIILTAFSYKEGSVQLKTPQVQM